MTLRKSLLRRSAYTLFELVVVMALALIVAGMATPLALQHRHEDVKVTAAADVVRARWADCRAKAQDESRPYRFSVIPDTGKFKLEPVGGNSLLGHSMVAANQDASADAHSMEDSLPTGVRFGTKDHPASTSGPEAGGGEYVVVAVFMPDGTAQDDVEINFGARGAGNVILRLEASTGTVSSERMENQR
jgi:Tfp pilus assembly protein FimT